MKDNKRKYSPNTAQKEGRMSRCKHESGVRLRPGLHATGARLRPGMDTREVTLINPLTFDDRFFIKSAATNLHPFLIPKDQFLAIYVMYK